ncbi:MAG: LAGLIDADG family homing endonuclease [Candidatus Aenigmatarchaeota archaeon]
MAVEEIVVGRDPEDMKTYGKRGCIFLGKHIVGKGSDYHLTNPVLMDVLRPHIVLVTGKRGQGKCLEGNTLIPLNDGLMVPIKDLEDRDDSIFALNKRLKTAPAYRDGFFKRKVDRLLHVKLRSGREIKLTPEHPLLTIKGWKDAKELTVGSRIAAARKIECFGNQMVEEHKIKLLAYLLAEGHLSNSFVLFSNNDKYICEDFFESVKIFDSTLKIERHSKDGCYRVSKSKREVDRKKMKLVFDGQGFAKGTYTPMKKSSLREWLEEIGVYGRLSKDKFIPDIIFRLEKSQLSLFLNRLFSCDGSIYRYKTKNGYVWEISYCSSSKKMIRQVQHLLLRFGIQSKIKKKNIKINNKVIVSFEIVISSGNIETFIREIGFFSVKTKRQSRCLNEINDINRNPNVDTVPKDIWDIYRPENWAECGRHLGYTTPKALRSSINYSPSRQKLLQIAEVDNSEMLHQLATSDIFWDEIVLIEVLEGEFEVYDISVPELHNFIANDIIVHNSYTAAIIAEEIMKQPDEVKLNLSCLMIDTMGIFWSMKNPNDKDLLLLNKWGLKPQGFNVKNIVPFGLVDFYEKAGIAYDGVFSIKPSDLSAADWALTFNIDIFEPLGILLERTLKKLSGDYSINDIIDQIEDDKRSDDKEKMALENRFVSARGWGIFSEKATPIEEILEPGVTTILDVSLQEWNVRNLLVGILSREIYQARVSARRQEELAVIGGEDIKKVPMTWIILDEVHNFIPDDGKTAATNDMLTLIKQGRQPGISLVLITQRPNKLHGDAISQSDMVISHRLTAKPDLDALSAVMQTYLLFDIRKSISSLPRMKGAAVVLDDNSERLFSIQVRPRQSWHAGASPVALKEKATY